MRSFFHPPPPASSLTRFDRHCYNHLSYHRLTSLLLVLCLALGLVACQSGGSSASSANNDENISVNDGSDSSDSSDINGDETPTLVDNADISIADLSDSSKSIISMREFLLTVTYNNLNTKKELNFIVGESTTPPTWNSVKANPTTITRAFNNGNLKTRRIYFSATEKLTDVSYDADGNASISGKVIDLSQAGSQGDEADYTKAQAPGIMAPNTSYYVYVYDSRGALVKQQTVTTAGYPTDPSSFIEQVGAAGGRTSGASFDEYFWGMDAWRDASGDYQIVKDVEVKKGEVFFLPLRTRSIVDWDISEPNNFGGIKNSYCTGSFTKRFIFQTTQEGFLPDPTFTFTPSGVDRVANLFSFTNSPKIFPNLLPTIKTNQTFDFVYLSRVRGTGQEIRYSPFEKCLNGVGGTNIAGGTILTFTLITE